MLKNLVSMVAVIALLFVFPRCYDDWTADAPNVESIHAENAVHAAERAAVIPAGFVVPDSFPEILAALKQLTGSEPTPFEPPRDNGPAIRTPHLQFKARSDTAAKAIADTAGILFRPRGVYLFSYGVGMDYYVVAMKSGDPYQAMELMDVNGNLFGPKQREIIAFFRALEKEQPFVISHLDHDVVEGRFLTPIKDAASLARRFNKVCPDIVRQGTKSVRNLEIELRESRYLYCWWD